MRHFCQFFDVSGSTELKISRISKGYKKKGYQVTASYVSVRRILFVIFFVRLSNAFSVFTKDFFFDKERLCVCGGQ